MTLRLDPRFPLIWRTPDSIQFGLDRPAATLEGVSLVDERMIAALVSGVPESGLLMIAHDSGGAPHDVERLLERLRPVLLVGAQRSETRRIRVQLQGSGPTFERLRALLRDLGFDTGSGLHPGRVDFAIILSHFAIAPSVHGQWLRRDVPHLPIVFSDAGYSIGPTIEAGGGPCLYCVDLHRTDSDPQWPAIATQLSRRLSGTELPLQVADAVHRAARVVSDYFASERPAESDLPTSIYVEAESGAITTRRHSVHPQCGCRSLQETAMVSAGPVG